MAYTAYPDISHTLPPSLTLLDKYAIITGSSRGIGHQTALTLASRGAHIAITYTSPDSTPSADALVSQIRALGRKATAIRHDLSLPDCGAAIVSAALTGLATEHIDILVNNAAIGQPGGPRPSTEPVTPEEFDRQFHVNVRAPMLLMQAVVPVFNPRGGNRIINISSVAARLPSARFQVYSATKSALDDFTRVWAAELAAERGCTVNSVVVGATATPDAPASEARNKAVGLITAQKRLGSMVDVADVVAFVACDASRWINGDRIGANGGMVLEA